MLFGRSHPQQLLCAGMAQSEAVLPCIHTSSDLHLA